MQDPVQMKTVPQARPASQREGVAFFQESIRPALELSKKLQDERKIAAGGPISGTIGIALIVNQQSPRELDDLLTSRPVWTRMETEVAPFTTFADRGLSIERRLSDSGNTSGAEKGID